MEDTRQIYQLSQHYSTSEQNRRSWPSFISVCAIALISLLLTVILFKLLPETKNRPGEIILAYLSLLLICILLFILLSKILKEYISVSINIFIIIPLFVVTFFVSAPYFSDKPVNETTRVIVSLQSENSFAEHTSPDIDPISGTEAFTNSLGMEFAHIPAGSFMMGSPPDEPGQWPDEIQHWVTLTRDFYMQTTEVTQGQWEAVMEDNPSHFKDCGDDCPVEMVSWNSVQEFITKLNKMGEGTYRLPTEAEWEYACRAETDTPFFFGRCLPDDQSNYDGTRQLKGCETGKNRGKTLPVASFSPNAWGLYDMHGNVWEWCQDWYGNYPDEPVTDPAGPDTGLRRVNRGGGWDDYSRTCRSAFRFDDPPFYYDSEMGFRLVRSKP